MRRFFVAPLSVKDGLVEITGQDVNHIKNVLRLNAEDEIEAIDENGISYQARIKTIASEKIICSILSSKKKDMELPVKVTIAQCLPKGKKMDLIVQKATELGVHAIIPVISERTVVKLEQAKDRWQKIAQEAAEQCGRTIVPKVLELRSFDQLLKLSREYDLVLIPWEGEMEVTLKAALSQRRRGYITPP